MTHFHLPSNSKGQLLVAVFWNRKVSGIEQDGELHKPLYIIQQMSQLCYIDDIIYRVLDGMGRIGFICH